VTWKALLPNLRSGDSALVVDFAKAALFRRLHKKIYEPAMEWFIKTFRSKSDAQSVIDRTPSLKELASEDKKKVVDFMMNYVNTGRVSNPFVDIGKELYIPSLCEVFGRSYSITSEVTEAEEEDE